MAVLTRDDYLEAGMALLAEGGVNAVTIARLCDRLGVTKGSFYHHFRGAEDLRSSLLAHWANRQAERVRELSAAVSDPVDRLTLLRDAGVALPHDAEVAIRAWARHDPEASEVRERVDVAREAVVRQAYVDVGTPPEVAEQLGRISVAVLIGAQHRDRHTDTDGLRRMYSVLMEMAEHERSASGSGADAR